jgi:hypothetical protein
MKMSDDTRSAPAVAKDAAENRDVLLDTAARFAEHPAFDAAVLTYSEGLARLREAPRLINMIVATDVRWRITGFLLYLDADRERFGPEGGATYGRLLETCMARREASPRAVKAVLALLQLGGLVQVVSNQADRRVKFYRPTERMFDFVRQWLTYGAAALDVLDPSVQRSRFIKDRAFIDAFSISGGRAHLEDPVPLADQVPEPLSSLKSMLGSYSVILAVVLAHLTNSSVPSQHAIARRFGMSRRQVGNVMAAASTQGLFASAGSGLLPTPALLASYRRWISIELAFYSQHMRVPGQP